MPALEVFGRRWHIAADDLPLPSLMGAIWHLSVLVLNAVDMAFVVRQLDASCYYRTRHMAYLSAHIACFSVNTVLHTWTFFESVRGTIFQVHRRRRVPALVLAIVLLYVLTIVNNGYGTRLVYLMDSMTQCDAAKGPLQFNHFLLMEAIVIATWVSLFVGFLAMVITLNLFSTYKTPSSPWLKRFKCCRWACFCCVGTCVKHGATVEGDDDRQHDDSDGGLLSPMVVIANIFTAVFGAVDMTLTDYIASFALVGVRHRYNKPALSYANAQPPSWLAAASSAQACGTDGPILQPPLVLEMAASGKSPTRPDKPCTAGADEVALEFRQEAPPTPSPAPAALPLASVTVNTTTPTTSDTAILPSTATTTTTSNSILNATAGSFPTNGTGKHRPFSISPSSMDRGALPIGPASPVAPTPMSPDENAPLREWDSENLARPNASEAVMVEALHYMRFATAVYGWKMYLWMNRLKVTNCCRLCLGRGCGCCKQSSYFIRSLGPDYGPSEGCCSAVKLLEREAITQLTGVQDDDILYVCYDNRVGGLLPYYIALDRQRSSIVVGIRGSLSLADLITDLLCEPAEYQVPGAPSKDASGRVVLWAHRGMLESTRAILKDIQEQGVLQAAVAPWPGAEAEQQALLQRLPSARARSVAQRLQGAASGFRVVITGHSLGAGVTGLLGPLLHPDFPNLRCWAFAPPGGLMSRQAAELTREFCVSVVHAKDMISRLGVGPMEALVQELVGAAAHSAVNKLTIMGRLVVLGQRPDPQQMFLPPGEELTSELKEALKKYSSRLEDTPSAKVAVEFDLARDFVPPGHVLYVERRKLAELPQSCCTCSCNICLLDKSALNCDYVVRWIQVSDLMKAGLIVSRSMFLDHLPDNTLFAFETALRHMRGDKSRAAAPGRDHRTGSIAMKQPQRQPSVREQEQQLQQVRDQEQQQPPAPIQSVGITVS